MNTFYIGKALQVAWGTFKVRPFPFFVMAVILTIPNLLSYTNHGAPTIAFPFLILVWVALWLVAMYFSTLFALKAHDDIASLSFSSLWQWGSFVPYALGLILYFVVVALGVIVLIVPGVILTVMFMFSYLLIVDKQMKVLEAFKKSREVTKGHRWHLFVLLMVMMGVGVVVGLSADFVLGLLGIFSGAGAPGSSGGTILYEISTFVGNITMVIFSISFVHAYRVLTGTKAPDATVSVAV